MPRRKFYHLHPKLLNKIISLLVLVNLVLVVIFLGTYYFNKTRKTHTPTVNLRSPTTGHTQTTTSTPTEPTLTPTTIDIETLTESSTMQNSINPDWWLSSGAYVFFSNIGFTTNLGKLDNNDKWRKTYAGSNPTDTDNGYYPQNIFRLVRKSLHLDATQQVYFKIAATNLSESTNRDESNGVFLFNRYQNEDNLYYTGIRVDGGAVIKKKINGNYFTLAYKKIFNGKYDKNNVPNILPLNKYLGIKSELKNIDQNAVQIDFYLDNNDGRGWEKIFTTVDDGRDWGEPFNRPGHVGIRGDFMDLEFKDYETVNI